MRTAPVVLFPYLSLSSFIQRDIDSLRKAFLVELVDCRRPLGLLGAVAAVPRSDVILCWFGSLRYLPIVAAARMLGKPVCIVAGGYDVASLPAIGYGTMARPIPRALGRWLFKKADMVAAFSSSAAREAIVNARAPSDRVSVIPLGYDDDPVPISAKEPIVLCVANIDPSTLLRKGLLTFARLSARMPEVRFVLAGSGAETVIAKLRAEGGPNLLLPGGVTETELTELYAKASVYLQPSLHEGFGSAVAEAMLHNCIPVVSTRFSLPEVVGPCGLYADPDDLAGLAGCISEVLAKLFRPPESPRSRILREFPAGRRERALLAAVRRLVEHGGA